jgi:hypothetical protein
MLDRRSVTIGLLGAASACATPQQTIGVFEGVYGESFEMMAFMPNARDEWWRQEGERWWVEFTGRSYRAILDARPPDLPANAGFWMYVVFEGELSSPGEFGHLGSYPRLLRVTRVRSARFPSPIAAPDRPS